MVLTQAEYFYGTKAVSHAVMSYFGLQVSLSTIKSNILVFRKGIQDACRSLLLAAQKVLMSLTYDNTQIVIKLKYQCGGVSTTSMKGTVHL